MKILFSRHAKRRTKLYGITESLVFDILAGMKLMQGEHEIVSDVEGLQYPLKIIVSVEENSVTVITAYPLKKGRTK